MSDANKIEAFVRNLLGEEMTEMSVRKATLIRATRFDWRRDSLPLPEQPLATHKRWLDVWRRLELSGLHHL